MNDGTVAALLGALTDVLRARFDAAEARAEARLILAHATGIDRLRQTSAPTATVDAAAAAQALDLAARRAAGTPLAYLTGRREFWSLDLGVGPGVLVPRPDSETLVETALAHLAPDRPARIVDLGTGSGCLLLAVLHERPRVWGVGVDRSAAALGYARRNAAALGLAGRATFVQADWWAPLAGPFDLVLANPPYVATNAIADLMVEVRGHEPRAALDGGSDGLMAYRRLLPELPSRLATGGLALFEIGHDQGEAVLALARAAGLERLRLVRDLAGRDRCLAVSG